ncbi:putative solute carrier family 35 member SLC35F1/F2/F6 [Helianthus annuus]|nr:putative solute carrier family 35 member SLC35F1/F2/F6 [Helianthus annuus]
MLAIVYGGILLYRRSGLKAKWYYYLLLGLVDVEANYLGVAVYINNEYNAARIPSVILLTWLFLKTKYRYKKIAGVAICIAGLVLVIFSDVHAHVKSGSNPIKGDFLVVAGATLYAVSNVSEEFFVKTADRIELMAMFSGIQIILEREELKSIHWSSGSLLPYTGFAAAMFLFYSGVPVLLKWSNNVESVCHC